MMLNTKMSRKGRGDFQVCTKFLSLWTKTQLTEIFVAIFYSLTAARRAPKCNYSAIKHWTNTVQTECRAKWSEVICLLHQHEKGITDLLGFASSPLLSCSRSASRNLHHGLFKDTLWKPKNAQDEIFSLSGMNFTWHPSPWTTLSTSSTESLQIRVQSTDFEP